MQHGQWQYNGRVSNYGDGNISGCITNVFHYYIYNMKRRPGMKFTKMHGAGNDYIYVDCTQSVIDNPSQVAIDLSDRHFGPSASYPAVA